MGMQRALYFLSIQFITVLLISLTSVSALAQMAVCQLQCKSKPDNEYSQCMDACHSGTVVPSCADNCHTSSGGNIEQYQACLCQKCGSNGGDGQFQCPTSSSASATTCNTQMQALIQKCNESTSEAQNSCDDSQNTGLAQAQQAAVGIGSVVSQSVAAACSAMGKISQTANAAVAGYQMNCSASVSSCSSDCAAAMSYYNSTKGCSVDPSLVGPPGPPNTAFKTQITETQKVCTGLNAKVQQAQQALNNFMATTLQAQNCDSLTSGTSSVTTELCLQNPSLAGCSAINMDCSNAAMASNKVCICSKNPNDPSCLATQSASNMTTSASTTPGLTSSSASAGDLGDLGSTPEIAQGKMPTSGNDAPIDGKQGAGAALGGNSADGAAAGAAKKATGEAAAAEAGVNAGFYGGGSGGGSFGGSGGGGSGDPLNRFAMAAGAAGKKDGVNLRQFLPGGNMDPRARGLAGISGPDGITGPHSDIWQKIQNRYQVVGPSLMP